MLGSVNSPVELGRERAERVDDECSKDCRRDLILLFQVESLPHLWAGS
eukprot:COSAG02_NODE_2429_length_8885_cov_3.820965_1_plen_47_part_10